jgi:20S proteasome subunit alpha 7
VCEAVCTIKNNQGYPRMSSLDFCTIYTPTGQISQLSYAQKAADAGDTCIGIKNSNGIVFVVEKPKTSALYVLESDERINKVSDSVAIVCSGVMSDAFYVPQAIKGDVFRHKDDVGEVPSAGFMKMYLNQLFHYFTRSINLRVLGVNALCSVYKEGRFSLLHTDCTGRTVSYKASCIGRGARRVKTELEKLDIDGMSIEQMVETAIKMLYIAHDPSKDKAFDIEVGVVSLQTEGRLKKLEKQDIQHLVDKYKDISADEY